MKNKTMIWAVDPFDSETKATGLAVQAMARWAREARLQLQPVFIMPMPLETLERGSLAAVDEAQSLLEEYVNEYGIKDVAAPELILDESNTRLGAVQALLAFAKKSNAAAISLSSHGRASLKRFVFGSFAEQLLRDSAVPVLFLSKRVPAAKSLTALFSTDFSTPSRRAFRKFLQLAGPLGMDIVLFHAVSLPAPVSGGMVAAAPSAYIPEDYFPREEARARKESAVWVKEANAAGVSARLQLSDRGIGMLTGEVIIEAAERSKANIIAMATQSRPIENFIFGSAALDVFRSSSFPVWAYGPKALNSTLPKRTKAASARPRGLIQSHPKKKTKAAHNRLGR